MFPRSLGFVLAALSCLIPTAAWCEALDPSAYEVQEQDKLTDSHGGTSWLSVLRLREPDVTIPLMAEQSPSEKGRVMDRKSLRVEWLFPNEILWISWKSLPFSDDGIRVRGYYVIFDASGRRKNELLRRAFNIRHERDAKDVESVVVTYSLDHSDDNKSHRIRERIESEAPYSHYMAQAQLDIPGLKDCASAHVRLISECQLPIRHSHVNEDDTFLYMYEGGEKAWVDLSPSPNSNVSGSGAEQQNVGVDGLVDFIGALKVVRKKCEGYGFEEDKTPQPSNADEETQQTPRTLSRYERDSIKEELFKLNPHIEDGPELAGLVPVSPNVFPVVPISEDSRLAPFWGLDSSSPAQWLDDTGTEEFGPVQFEGMINNNLRIRMMLTFQGKKVTGSYFYDKYKKDIALNGERTGESLRMEESDGKGIITGRIAASFVSPTDMKGDWTSADGKRTLPFVAGIWCVPSGKDESQSASAPPAPEIRYELSRTEVPGKHDFCRYYQYFLKFADQNASIPLAKFCEEKERTADQEGWGFDAHSFAATPMSDSLYQVTWHSVPQGNGEYSNWCTVLLEKRPAGWHDVFRDEIYAASGRGGASDAVSSFLRFEIRPSEGLFIRETTSVITGSPYEPFGSIGYGRRKEWPCRLTRNGIEIGPGRSLLRLDDGISTSIWKLAHFTTCDDILKSNGDKHSTTAQLRSLNPYLRRSNVCGGLIVMSQVLEPRPYSPVKEFSYSAVDGVGCPCQKDTNN